MRRLIAIFTCCLILSNMVAAFAAITPASAQTNSCPTPKKGIAIIRYSTWVSPSYVKSMAAAMNQQIQNDYPAMGWSPCFKAYAVDALNGEGYTAGDWPEYIMNGASTFHTYNTTAQTPVAYADPTEWTAPGVRTPDMENAVSHEMLEMASNPSPDQTTAGGAPRFGGDYCSWINKGGGYCRYFYEVADEVQDTQGESYLIPSPYDNQQIDLSDFVAVDWFAQYYPAPYDKMGLLSRWITLGEPGYDCMWWNYYSDSLSNQRTWGGYPC